MKSVLVVYVPVLHAGYLKLFKEYRGQVSCLYVLGDDLVREFVFLEPEIRAVDAESMRRAIAALNLFPETKILTKSALKAIKATPIIMVDDAISDRIAKKYDLKVKERVSVFLRWDEVNVLSQAEVNYTHITSKAIDRQLIDLATEASSQSGDWWRRVGAVVTRAKKPLFITHNRHVPTEQTVYANGDPRDFVPAGTNSEINTVLHGEQGIITKAAREGVSLLDTELYVTVFPCPMCAKQIAYSGIKRVYFNTGHASLDGESVLKSQGVEIVLVK